MSIVDCRTDSFTILDPSLPEENVRSGATSRFTRRGLVK